MLGYFIEVNQLKARLIACPDEVNSAVEAARWLRVPLEQIVKSLVFLDAEGEPVLLLLRGSDQADSEKVKKVLRTNQLKLVSPTQVLEITGYEMGGVPPISIFAMKTICDEKVFLEKNVFCGGGDNKTVLEISPDEIQKSVEDFEVADITSN